MNNQSDDEPKSFEETRELPDQDQTAQAPPATRGKIESKPNKKKPAREKVIYVYRVKGETAAQTE